MKPIRAFFAINLPEPILKSLKKQLQLLQYKLPTRAIRWTSIENLHITLQFIREIQYIHLNQLIENVEAELKNTAVFQLELCTLQLFPSAKRPRVIVMQAGPHDSLANLAHKIGLGISATNYTLAREEFRGHLTLGRIVYQDKTLDTVAQIELPPIPKTEIREICLFESKTGHKSQIYIPLKCFRFSSVSHSFNQFLKKSPI